MVRKTLSWLLGIASPSKAIGVDPSKCMIANCNARATHNGFHYLLGAFVHVCWWHQWTLRRKQPLTAADLVTLKDLLAQHLTPPASPDGAEAP